MLNNCLVFLLLLSGLPVVAAYEYAIELELQTEAAGYQFNVPASVYQHVHHADLRDVRILNALGDEVPLRITMDEDRTRTSWSEVTLPVFTLHTVEHIPVTSKQVKTSWDGGQQSVTVTTSEQVVTYLKNREKKPENSFLLDASAIDGETSVTLELDWEFSTPGNRVFYVDLLGSNDLSRWQNVHIHHKLIELNTGGQVVFENRLQLPQKTHAFYQLRFKGPEVPEIQRVKAAVVKRSLDRPLQWSTVDQFHVGDRVKYGHALEWDLGAHYPVEMIRLGFNYKNLMAHVRLYSKPQPHSHWHLLSEKEVYDVGEGALSMFNNQMRFVSNNHRYWRLTSDSEINSQWVEDISFAWRGHQIKFLAQGEGPYTLVFGNQAVNSWPSITWYQTLNQAMRQNMFSGAVVLGPVNKVPPAEEKTVPVQETTHYSRWVFWSLLAVVLLLLGMMAARLLHEVEQD